MRLGLKASIAFETLPRSENPDMAHLGYGSFLTRGAWATNHNLLITDGPLTYAQIL